MNMKKGEAVNGEKSVNLDTMWPREPRDKASIKATIQASNTPAKAGPSPE